MTYHICYPNLVILDSRIVQITHVLWWMVLINFNTLEILEYTGIITVQQPQPIESVGCNTWFTCVHAFFMLCSYLFNYQLCKQTPWSACPALAWFKPQALGFHTIDRSIELPYHPSYLTEEHLSPFTGSMLLLYLVPSIISPRLHGTDSVNIYVQVALFRG